MSHSSPHLSFFSWSAQGHVSERVERERERDKKGNRKSNTLLLELSSHYSSIKPISFPSVSSRDSLCISQLLLLSRPVSSMRFTLLTLAVAAFVLVGSHAEEEELNYEQVYGTSIDNYIKLTVSRMRESLSLRMQTSMPSSRRIPPYSSSSTLPGTVFIDFIDFLD